MRRFREGLRDLLQDRVVSSDVEHHNAAAFGMEKRGGGKADAPYSARDQG